MRISFSRLFLLLILAAPASSCNKKCENMPPVITIAQPIAAATIHLPDSVRIEGTVSDDVWLNALRVLVLNENGDTVFTESPDVYGNNEASFAYNYFTGTAGSFRLQIMAQDNVQSIGFAEVVFQVLP